MNIIFSPSSRRNWKQCCIFLLQLLDQYKKLLWQIRHFHFWTVVKYQWRLGLSCSMNASVRQMLYLIFQVITCVSYPYKTYRGVTFCFWEKKGKFISAWLIYPSSQIFHLWFCSISGVDLVKNCLLTNNDIKLCRFLHSERHRNCIGSSPALP